MEWDRDDFANYTCKLFMKQYDTVELLISDIKQVKTLHKFFDIHVRNIYELEDKIPLFHLYYLMEHGAENFGYSESEFNNEVSETITKVKKQYEDK